MSLRLRRELFNQQLLAGAQSELIVLNVALGHLL